MARRTVGGAAPDHPRPEHLRLLARTSAAPGSPTSLQAKWCGKKELRADGRGGARNRALSLARTCRGGNADDEFKCNREQSTLIIIGPRVM